MLMVTHSLTKMISLRLPLFSVLLFLFMYFVAVFCSSGIPLLPNLTPARTRNIQLDYISDVENLLFTTSIANIGVGPFDVYSVENPQSTPSSISTPSSKATQLIYDASGAVVETNFIGDFVYHPSHHHWHLENVARYSIYPALDNGNGGRYNSDSNVGISKKVTFCMEDSVKINPSVTAAPVYTVCGAHNQGISPGYLDVYAYFIPDQSIETQNFPDGIYYIVTEVNPDGWYKESNYTDNINWSSFSCNYIFV